MLILSVFKNESNDYERKKEDGRIVEDNFSYIPDELGLEILSYLSLSNLLSLKSVSKSFYRWVEMLGVGYKEFKFEKTGDENGILYWIGTNRGLSEYSNPSETKRVEISANHRYSNFVGRTPFWARNVGDCLHTYYEVDFGEEKVICPNHYTMTYGNDGSGWEPRNWKLIASNNRMDWTVLREHRDDETLNGAFSMGEWKIENIPKPKPSFSFLSSLGLSSSDKVDRNGRGFRYFRLVQTGKNKSGYHTFFVCGFELYGKVHFNERKGEKNSSNLNLKRRAEFELGFQPKEELDSTIGKLTPSVIQRQRLAAEIGE